MQPHHETKLLLRAIGALAFTGIALIHLLDLQSKLDETPYLAAAYIVLIVGLLVATARLVRSDERSSWTLGGSLAALTLLGYAVNRTVGMPDATGDIGNWLEPLGLASLFVEGVAVATAVAALRLHDTEAGSQPSPDDRTVARVR